MNRFAAIILGLVVYSSAEDSPEIPENTPMPKTVAWEILDKQWKVIEPLLFTEAGKKHLGRSVYFVCTFEFFEDGIKVKTPLGTEAVVTRIPPIDMKLLKRLKPSQSPITVEGTLVEIDAKNKQISIQGGGIRSGTPKLVEQYVTPKFGRAGG